MLEETTRSRFPYLPSSIRLLLTPGVRGHTLIFGLIMTVLAGIAYGARALGAATAWTAIFALGASTASSYLVFTVLTLTEKTKSLLFHSRMQTRVILMALVFGPILGGISYWIYKAGSVESLPIFPIFITIFYAWTLLQSYFIATPVSQLLNRIETRITGEGKAKTTARWLGIGVLFLPAVPLLYGVWAISTWLNSTYQNIQGASGQIVTWTLIITVLLILSYFLTVNWGWKAVKQKKPEAAIFVGGTFLAVWAYLLYRATMVVMGFVTQNQPTNAVLDSGLVIVSIIGAMQTFARKTLRRADPRWSQSLPFLVFAFGTVFAVAQYYYILQYAVTRLELSIAVNATVFATGLLLMLYLIRRHLHHVMSPVNSQTAANQTQTTTDPPEANTDQSPKSVMPAKPRRPLLSFHWGRKKKTMAEQVEELVNESKESNQAEVSEQNSPESAESVAEEESLDQDDS
ncbi:MAG TPA: hypothetical protein VFE98_09520 [Candidatus Bathyarchaeia archaeon]|nr:hypothetical protein [Candidatus Bathyarchaeia archaeon]